MSVEGTTGLDRRVRSERNEVSRAIRKTPERERRWFGCEEVGAGGLLSVPAARTSRGKKRDARHPRSLGLDLDPSGI